MTGARPPRLVSGLHNTLCVTRLIKEDDLSNAVFYDQIGYSLIRPKGRIDCKNAVYTPPQGEKAANSDGGIDLKYAAEFLLAGTEMSETSQATTASVILVGGSGWASLWPEFERVAKTKALGYLKQWWRDVSFFHADGHLYSVTAATPDRPVGSLARLLAQSFFLAFESNCLYVPINFLVISIHQGSSS